MLNRLPKASCHKCGILNQNKLIHFAANKIQLLFWLIIHLTELFLLIEQYFSDPMDVDMNLRIYFVCNNQSLVQIFRCNVFLSQAEEILI